MKTTYKVLLLNVRVVAIPNKTAVADFKLSQNLLVLCYQHQ